MSLSSREFWTLVHGMGLGAIYLLAFAGGLAGLYSLRPEWLTAAGLQDRVRRLHWGIGIMAAVCWLTVITGTWIVYPWYRAAAPQGATDLAAFPKAFLVANTALAGWHNFGMEWKEHIAWISPFVITAVAFVVWRYGDRLSTNERMRKTIISLFVVSFVLAGVAGALGALITKAAPVR
jgi:hypothetical protein